jgi:hypothetical protein
MALWTHLWIYVNGRTWGIPGLLYLGDLVSVLSLSFNDKYLKLHARAHTHKYEDLLPPVRGKDKPSYCC